MTIIIVRANTLSYRPSYLASFIKAPIEEVVYVIISAAISDFQARPTEVITAGKRYLISVGTISIFSLFGTKARRHRRPPISPYR